MKINKLQIISLLIVFQSIIITSCSQQEGIGGNSQIMGKIQVSYYNDDFSSLLSDKLEPACDEDVFLIFGNDSVVGEKVTTSNTGNFEYKYLWPGEYKLFYYSDDTTGLSSKKIALVKEITLGKNETLILDDLKIKKKMDWNEGNSSIKGTVFVINYKNSSTYPNLVIKDVTPAQEQEIYITYGNHPSYDDRIRTSGDGTFMFRNLIKGNYTIQLYSEDKTGGTMMEVIKKEIEITENNKQYFINDTIYINKL